MEVALPSSSQSLLPHYISLILGWRTAAVPEEITTLPQGMAARFGLAALTHPCLVVERPRSRTTPSKIGVPSAVWMAPLHHGVATSFKSIVDGAIGSWRGDTSFIGNIADRVYGGAVHVFNGASVSWSGQTNFTRNSAPVGGGALYSDNSVVTWTGHTRFVNHSASFCGGTILARFSNVSWSGVTSFESSTLRARLESGGTVQVEHSALFVAGRDVI